MTRIRTLLAGAGTAALLALPVTAQVGTPALPQELSGLNLTDLRDDRDGDDREIRATLDGTRFQVEYDDGRLEEIAAAPGATLPRPVIEAMVPEAILSAAGGMGIGEIIEVEFDDDGEIELIGTDGDGPVEATFSAQGRMMEFERRDRARRGPPDHAIRHGLTADDVRRIAADAGYGAVDWIEIRPRHVEFDAVDAEGRPVEVRLDETGQVERIERR